MVRPSATADDSSSVGRWLQVGFVATVSVSGGLVAVQAGGSGTQAAAAALIGLALGVALLAFLRRLAGEFGGRGR